MINKIFKYGEIAMHIKIDDQRMGLFVAKDICEILGLKDTGKALQSLDEDEKLTRTVFWSGQRRNMWMVSESGLYHLIFQSRKPEAKKFRKWVTSEVLPSIRKYGTYSMQRSDEEKIAFIKRICPELEYGSISDKTRLRRIVPVFPHFRSCRIARANAAYVQPDLPLSMAN